MSSGGGGGEKPFFCHVCSQRVTCADDSEPFCPICLEGFVEEWNPNPSANPNHEDDDSSDSEFPFHPFPFLPLLLSSASRTRPEPDMFDPLVFLQNHLRELHADGANVQFEFGHGQVHPSDQGFRFPVNIGDYFLGAGFEQLMQQLADNDPNRYGTPPAAKDAVESLPTITVDDDLLNSELNQCAVCQDEFEKGSHVTQMPCKHVYHGDCVIPWLRLHNSCPVCRYELPTDDPDYENRAQGGSRSGGSDDGGGGAGAGGNNRLVRRTFRIYLDNPFDAGGSAHDGGERRGRNFPEDMD
ncbi:hypothetical protein Fmac_023008 [Flemingia macrophylla]|uniref:RING-type E3 ubiquitin transferase n=1 Tax=Flemingia macrophylla TaxID=520843 RepID=A0ABD1LKA4_9FABA